MTLAALSSILVGFGLVNTLYRFSAQASDAPARHAVVANVFGLTLVIGAVALVLSQCASSQIAALLPGKANVVAVSLILVTLALEGVISIPLAWMRLQERADGFLLLNTSKELLQAALVVVALANDPVKTKQLGNRLREKILERHPAEQGVAVLLSLFTKLTA